MVTRLFTVNIASQQSIVLCRQRARDIAAALGFGGQHQIQIATAVSEIARNVVEYAGNGTAEFALRANEPHFRRGTQAMVITIRDRGPGIPHLDAVLGGTYVSSTGLGIGIQGSKRLLDSLEIESSPAGTVVVMREWLPRHIAPFSPRTLQKIVDDLMASDSSDSFAEVQWQNQELVRMLEQVQTQQDQLAKLNEELADTNRGVVALYDELETLHRISTIVVANIELKPLLGAVTEAATRIIGADFGISFYRRGSGEPFQLQTAYGVGEASLESVAKVPRERLFRNGFEAGKVIRCDNLCTNRCQTFRIEGIDMASCLVVPIWVPERGLIAALVFGHAQAATFNERSERFMGNVANQVSIGIQNACLYWDVMEANAAKDKFLAVLSHELRTPLNPVFAIAQALEHDPELPQRVREEITVLRRNVELEARLIDDLLDINRIAKGKVQLALELVDINALLRNVVEICRGDIVARALTLELSLVPPDSIVRADPARLQQVFWNILKNAIKFTAPGGKITIASRRAGEGHVRIEFTDTGCGIEAATLPKIFNAFEQGDLQNPTQFGGLGLGLAITKALVDAHHGEIVAISEGPGQGAAFVVTLPRSADDLPVPAKPLAEAVKEGKNREARILLVEDHADTLRTMKRLLERRGYTVTTAADMASALRISSENEFDVMISDIGLPDGSGLDLMRRLRAKKNLVGIALSGFGMEEDIQKSKDAGFARHLTKPINLQLLGEYIDEAVG